ncbi:MAG TPA: hypothetical protein VGB50_05960 [Flavobacterium sp.]|jgi:hypothetical protein
MKNIVPNQIFNLTNNPELFQKPNVMTKKLLLLLCLTLSFADMYAQTAKTSAPGILRAKEFLKTSNNSAEAARAGVLLKELQPALYVSSGEIKAYGEQPTIIFTDPATVPSLAGLQISNTARASVEAVTIRINSSAELQTTIDLSSLSSFPNLKYVYVLCTVETSPENLLQKITNGASYRVIYDIEKGS